MKKALAFALSAIMVLGTVMPAMAANGNGNGEENGYDYNYEYEYDYDNEYDYGYDYELEYDFLVGEGETAPLGPVGRTGYITEYENGRLTVKLDEYSSIILNLQPGTVIIEAETGLPASLADRTNDSVKIYHSPVVTMSEPPQSNAIVVAINLPESQFAPIHHVVEKIEFYDEDTVKITVDNGGLIITLERETPLFPHLTRQMIDLEHLQVGDSLLFWYEIVGMSFPGFTVAQRALWLSAGEVADEYNGYNGYEYNGEPSTPVEVVYDYPTDQVIIAVPGTGMMRDGVEFFAVRATLYDATGLQPEWDDSIRSAVYTINGTTVILPSYSAVFYVNGVAYPLPASTFLYNGRIFAPAEFFAVFK